MSVHANLKTRPSRLLIRVYPETSEKLQDPMRGPVSGAVLFFDFGNTTYALSIMAKSIDKEYLIKNGGWLAGM